MLAYPHSSYQRVVAPEIHCGRAHRSTRTHHACSNTQDGVLIPHSLVPQVCGPRRRACPVCAMGRRQDRRLWRTRSMITMDRSFHENEAGRRGSVSPRRTLGSQVGRWKSFILTHTGNRQKETRVSRVLPQSAHEPTVPSGGEDWDVDLNASTPCVCNKERLDASASTPGRVEDAGGHDGRPRDRPRSSTYP